MVLGSASWSSALPAQDNFFAPGAGEARLAWDDSGFYAGAPHMTPGSSPGVGGGWRAHVSGFPGDAALPFSCAGAHLFCAAFPQASECRWLQAKCTERKMI